MVKERELRMLVSSLLYSSERPTRVLEKGKTFFQGAFVDVWKLKLLPFDVCSGGEDRFLVVDVERDDEGFWTEDPSEVFETAQEVIAWAQQSNSELALSTKEDILKALGG